MSIEDHDPATAPEPSPAPGTPAPVVPATGDPAPGTPAPGDPAPVEGVRRRPRRRGRRLALAAGALGITGAVLLGAAFVVDGPAEAGAAAPPGGGPALTTSLVSARRAPLWTTELVARRALAEAVAPVVGAAPPDTCIGVGDGREALYAHNATVPLQPASNLKLLTAAGAREILGPDATLDTDFRVAAAPVGGVVAGNLHMVGGGDPLLTTEAYQGRQRNGRLPETDLEGVADQLVATGIRRIEGSVVGDASRYDGQRSAQGWAPRWLSNNTVAPLSALMVNDAWLIDPTTGAGEGGSAEDPAAHAAGVLTQLLRERGVEVIGEPSSGPPPPGATSVLTVPSLPVSALVEEVLRHSDNTTAELLLKEIGLAARGAGSTEDGAAALTEWVAAKGWPTEGVVVADGSGLSPANRLSCDLLAAVLRADGPDGPLAAGLAVPGGPGTLNDRLTDGEWPQRVRAKTGTLNEVTALSGWLATRPGANLDFEILVNTPGGAAGPAEVALQTRLLEALVDQPRPPPIEQAGPVPVATP